MEIMKEITATLIVSVSLAALSYWYLNLPTAKAVSFNQRLWLEASSRDQENDPGCYRGGMAMELVDKRLLNGKTGPELISLIGVPSNSSAGSWTYPVGQCGMLWEHFHLRVDVGPEGEVIGAAVVKDES
jgi:hypothetical protein